MHIFRTMEDISQHTLWTHACFVLSEISSTMSSISVRLNEPPCRNIHKDEKQAEGDLHSEYVLERHYTEEETGRLLCSASQSKCKCNTKLSQHISPPGNILPTWNLLSKETSRWRIFPTYGRPYIVEALLVSQKLWQDTSVGIAMWYGQDCRTSIPGRGKFTPYSTAFRPDIEPTSLLSDGYMEPFPRE
jgi:hypothetical protein